ncbi:hypothetical protein FGRMN_3570, partial [Fusarium graminum]
MIELDFADRPSLERIRHRNLGRQMDLAPHGVEAMLYKWQFTATQFHQEHKDRLGVCEVSAADQALYCCCQVPVDVTLVPLPTLAILSIQSIGFVSLSSSISSVLQHSRLRLLDLDPSTSTFDARSLCADTSLELPPRLPSATTIATAALNEPRTSSKTPATTATSNSTPVSGGAAISQASGHQRQQSHQPQPQPQLQQHQHQLPQDQHYQVQQHQRLLDEADSASHGVHFGQSQSQSHNNAGASVSANANVNASAKSSANNPSTITPHSALSSSHNTAFSSSESFDAQQPPPSTQYLQKQQPPLHLQHPQQQPQGSLP